MNLKAYSDTVFRKFKRVKIYENIPASINP